MDLITPSTIVVDPVTGNNIRFSELTTESQQQVLDTANNTAIAESRGPAAIVTPPSITPPVILTESQLAAANASATTVQTPTIVSNNGERSISNLETTNTNVSSNPPADSATPEMDAARAQLRSALIAQTQAADAVQIATDYRDATNYGTAEFTAAQERLTLANEALSQVTLAVDTANDAVDQAQYIADVATNGTVLYISPEDEQPLAEIEGEAIPLGTTDIPGEINLSGIMSKGVNLAKGLSGAAGSALGGLSRLASVGLGAAGLLGANKSLLDPNSVMCAREMSFEADWRVRLALPNNLATELLAQTDGLLTPLVDGKGIVFPYTPNITVSYTADWQAQKLTHSNYSSQNYSSSEIQDIQIQGTFTAQNEDEAEYLLAVLTFGKLVTKMFYGKSSHAGNPPPILHLYGHGAYQWQRVPVVVKNFQYALSADVDYIAVRKRKMTRVPMIIENMSWTVAPVYSRQQMTEFSYGEFAKGALIEKGFI